MSDLAEFVRKMLDDGERVARKAIEQREQEIARGVYRHGHEPGPDPETLAVWDDWTGGPGIRMGAERLLADVEAKRRVISMYEDACHRAENAPNADAVASARVSVATLQGVLTVMAQVYKDHPEFKGMWEL